MKQLIFACIFFLLTALPAFAININTADQETLQNLHGVGPAKAAAIVKDREKNGKFHSPEELTRVRGIGMKLLQKNQGNIEVD